MKSIGTIPREELYFKLIIKIFIRIDTSYDSGSQLNVNPFFFIFLSLQTKQWGGFPLKPGLFVAFVALIVIVVVALVSQVFF